MPKAMVVKGAGAAAPEVLPGLTPRGARTRARILEAAEQVFSERTYDEASIVQITQTAGVAMGTFYLYFPSKQAIFAELVRDLGHNLRASIATAAAGLTSRIDIERAGFRAFFDFTAKHPGLYRIIRSAEAVDRGLYEEHYEKLAEGYVAGLRKAMGTGELRKQDPKVLAYILMGIAEMIGMRWVLWEPAGKVPDALLDEVMAFISRGAGAQ